MEMAASDSPEEVLKDNSKDNLTENRLPTEKPRKKEHHRKPV
jgi:hypothetical protein